MADLKETRHKRTNADDLSDAGSDEMETETLHEEELPSYEQPGPSHPAAQLPPEKSAHDLEPPKAHPAEHPASFTHNRAPTASAPFNFPTTDLPSYETAVDFQKPLAIPQCSPTPDAPFVSAYPTDLLSYGIPSESWYSFVDTLSAFLSAKVSQQAVHHAADVAQNIHNYHKQYVTAVKQSFRNMGKSAKQLNPFGVVGGALGLTFGTVGHAVGSIFNAPISLIQKPKTPRERATVYITTANKDWFHRRGLHALLLDTTELATVLGSSAQQILGAARARQTSDAMEQLTSLRKWIGDVQTRGNPAKTDDGDLSTSSSQLDASSARLTPVSSRQSKGKGIVISEWPSQLQLGAQTLWLVITQEKNVQAVEIDEKGRPVESRESSRS